MNYVNGNTENKARGITFFQFKYSDGKYRPFCLSIHIDIFWAYIDMYRYWWNDSMMHEKWNNLQLWLFTSVIGDMRTCLTSVIDFNFKSLIIIIHISHSLLIIFTLHYNYNSIIINISIHIVISQIYRYVIDTLLIDTYRYISHH